MTTIYCLKCGQVQEHVAALVAHAQAVHGVKLSEARKAMTKYILMRESMDNRGEMECEPYETYDHEQDAAGQAERLNLHQGGYAHYWIWTEYQSQAEWLASLTEAERKELPF